MSESVTPIQAVVDVLSERSFRGVKLGRERAILIVGEAIGRGCILCGAAPDGVAMFIPGEEFAKQLGAKPGATRLCVYSLCETHASPDSVDQIEHKLLEMTGAVTA